jgi:hypothetical protein
MRLGPEALLFLFPSFERELKARRALEPVEGLIVATSYWKAYEDDPLGPVWLSVDIWVSAGETRRRRLIDLGKEAGRDKQGDR